MTNAEWPGIRDADALNPTYVDEVDRLADAAKTGNWTVVFEIAKSGSWPKINQSRISGTSWFAPLHQAAFLGAPVAVAKRLLELGAWRSLRNADGDRPIDLAKRHGHHHLRKALAVPELNAHEKRRFVAWTNTCSRWSPSAPARSTP